MKKIFKNELTFNVEGVIIFLARCVNAEVSELADEQD